MSNISTQTSEIKPYDILSDRFETQMRLKDSAEIDALTSKIDVSDLNTIISFGSEAAEEISKASDVILRSTSMSQLDESGEILKTLAKIMDQFDVNEVNKINDDPGMLMKIFGGAKKQLDKILTKYNTMGDEVDKIYIQLKQYEAEIQQLNQKLESMFQANVEYFHNLEKYIVAGDQGCQEIRDYIAELQATMSATGDQSISFEIHSLSQAVTMLEQRTMDLRTAESVALQSIPMIKTIQFSNMNLVRKINSAFIVTLPVFKQALAQAIMLKRQRLQADAIAALDSRTNEMLLRNAQNTVEQVKQTTRMASGSSINTETLVSTWHTILDGINDTKQIQDDARSQQLKDKEKLEEIKKNIQLR